MIKVNKKEDWVSKTTPLNNEEIDQRLLVVTDITDFPKKTVCHSHNWVQFIYTRTGTVYVEVNGKFWHLPPLHGVWIPKNYEHTFWSSEKSEYICININDDFRQDIRDISCKLVEVSNLVDCYSSYLMTSDKEKGDNLSIKEQAFIKFLIELPEVDFTLPYPASAELIHLCREIQSSPSQPHSPEECAQKLNISLSTFVRKFKKETGMTYQEWRQRMRLLQSISYLKQGQNVLNVALDMGYSSASSYIYAFKKNFGVSPTKYVKED